MRPYVSEMRTLVHGVHINPVGVAYTVLLKPYFGFVSDISVMPRESSSFKRSEHGSEHEIQKLHHQHSLSDLIGSLVTVFRYRNIWAHAQAQWNRARYLKAVQYSFVYDKIYDGDRSFKKERGCCGPRKTR